MMRPHAHSPHYSSFNEPPDYHATSLRRVVVALVRPVLLRADSSPGADVECSSRVVSHAHVCRNLPLGWMAELVRHPRLVDQGQQQQQQQYQQQPQQQCCETEAARRS